MLWNKWILRCLIIFNTFYWITGCIALSVGIYEITYSDYHFLRGKYDFGLFTGSYMICSCGIIILISSPFGWAGILSRSRGISISFCIILVLNGICLLSCGIWSSKYSENIHIDLNEMFDNLLKNYDEKRLMVNDETKFLNYIQYKFDCCGKLNVEDLLDRKPIIACGMKPIEKKGCLTKVIGTTKSGQFRIAFVSICLAMWQFFGIIIYSFFTCSNWNNQNHHHHFDY
ncbi:Tetraspanin-8 [Schistosoma haematobium]|uniref:Tetraspanin n=1 Tax=Schistosoma haematobium TaxID=6185 RepID=A0A094ZRH3_SCHHA|nr:Tetraspanin-8 [Schistosoma haematobium]KAH9585837.1 Tetraspanin-8 [Schistosoma haematobium]CAH8528144.1 unnamed protein product [Schistosoma haematobium]CAH8531427.1 unnamed protein product [Schistosoma haematobium]